MNWFRSFELSLPFKGQGQLEGAMPYGTHRADGSFELPHCLLKRQGQLELRLGRPINWEMSSSCPTAFQRAMGQLEGTPDIY